MEASRRRNPAADSGRTAGPRSGGAERQPATIEQPEGPREISDAPWPSELDLRTRLIVAAAAATDVPVRTALASIMFGASLQWGLSPGAWRERTRLRFYAELAQTRDATVVFPKPPDGVPVKLSRPGRLAFRAPGGTVSLLA